jgi:1-acyl-sn-glycerol-3-phosphate acyltransferase
MFRILLLPLNVLQLVLLWALTTLGVLFAMLVVAVAGRPQPSLWLAHRVWSPVALAILGGRLEVKAEVEPDWDADLLFASNHQSLADVPILFRALQSPLRFLAKKELFHLPVVGWYLRSNGMIPVDRRNRRAATQSLLALDRHALGGTGIVAFPEGTRARDGKVGAFKRGAFLLAIQTGRPIVPVAIEGSHRLVGRSGLTSRPARVRVRIGAPIPVAGLEPTSAHALAERVERAVRSLHEEAVAASGG